MKALCVAPETKAIFSNVDLAMEILYRLPTESILQLKCVCKRWYALFSHPSFTIAHFRRSPKTISGLFVQGIGYCTCCQNYLDCTLLDFISIGERGRHGNSRKVLEFLPEDVSVIASCDGILLCRNIFEANYPNHYFDRKAMTIKDDPKKVVLYVCNPLTREWTTLKPRGRYKNGCFFGFAYNPLGSKSTNSFSFEVVMVHPPFQLGEDPYRFKIYSTKTGTWRRSKEVCRLSHRVHLHCGCSANGVFYWWTTDHSVLTFDLKQEISQVIALPGHKMTTDKGVCMGVSEGKMHYICFNMDELLVWVLEHDSSGPKWVLKHSKLLLEMYHPIISNMKRVRVCHTDAHKRPNSIMRPHAFQDDILFMRVDFSMCSYNIKTGMIEEVLCSYLKLNFTPISIVIPYCKSLLQVERKDEQEDHICLL